MRELEYHELRKFYDKDKLGFKTTKELSPFEGLIGQARAAQSLRFGLCVNAPGYNIFVSGHPGTGRTTFAKKFAEAAAKDKQPPLDLCYVYNFDEPKCPKFLGVKNGYGKVLKADMTELVARLLEGFPLLFAGALFEEEKNNIVKVFHDKRESAIAQVTKTAKENGFGVKALNSGIQFLPIIDGELIGEEQFETLDSAVKADITARSETITEKTAKVMRIIKSYESDTGKEVEELEYKHGLFFVGRLMSGLFEKFGDEPDIFKYLSQVKEDILANMSDFLETGEQPDDELLQLMPWTAKKGKDSSFIKYEVNLLTDGSATAPVVVSHNATYTNLVGEIEYESELGNLTTDFTKIKPGLLHKANGGFLVLQADDVLGNYHVWETLKRALKTGEIVTEPIRDGGQVTAATLKPEPVPLDVKIILIGSGLCYDVLHGYEHDFAKLFRIHAEFDFEMPENTEHAAETARFVKKFVNDTNGADFTACAVAKLLEYSSRLAEDQDKLCAEFGTLTEVLTEAAAWAKADSTEPVTAAHIEKAIKERDKRLNMYEEKLGDMIHKNRIMIDTDGMVVAQINGLAVLESGGYAFAKPSRITATTYVGKAGIVNIEKEAEMSGSIHDKGIEVLTGYLGQLYAQEFPLSLSCRICFEQNYSGVDGDSASGAELFAILSSLANLPINQSIAVTGSINQRGEFQPIGGVTLKIEGFFSVCQKRGLTGKQGVIIPEQNVPDLALNDEVIAAVKAGKFHIYAIKTAEEALPLLMNTPAGEKSVRGKFPPDSVQGMVSRKLREFYKKSVAD